MSMSTYVVAIRPPDEHWQQMKAAYDAIKVAGLSMPNEIAQFFDCQDPDPQGVLLQLDGAPSVREWSNDYSQGLEVVLSELPPDVKILRFYNSW